MRFPAWLLSALVALPLAACAPERAPRAARGGAVPDSAVLVPAGAAELLRLAARPGARATVIHVWATWCGPCREEFPALLAVARRHPDVRLVLVSADFATQTADVSAFLAAHGVRDTAYLKHDGDQDFINGLDPHWSGALPATLVYDARGGRVASWEGAADSAKFESAIAAALRSPTRQEKAR
jgi:thiol-disulfide isomerase/thioredoxin